MRGYIQISKGKRRHCPQKGGKLCPEDSVVFIHWCCGSIKNNSCCRVLSNTSLTVLFVLGLFILVCTILVARR
ncbi:hypothetical protein Y032_0045g1202 [Ancylostoma ceylanicum]|nr:hypothetical protein Y032_0045g1202 [Ancylostoma ceylanicum]